jgi:hypothetical protein
MTDDNKAHEQQEQETLRPKLEYVVPDPESDLFTTYANNVQLGSTVYDMRMIFGELVEATTDKFVIEQRAHITVSWLQAKILSEMIARLVAVYESQHGEIKIPPGTLA